MAQLSNSPTSRVQLKLERAKSFACGIRFVTANGSPADMTDAELEVTVLKPPHRGGGIAVNLPCTWLDSAAGHAQLALQAQDLDLPLGEYAFSFTLLTADGYVSTVAKGSIEIVPNGSSTWSDVQYGDITDPGTLTFELARANTVAGVVDHLPQPELEIGSVTVSPSGEASATIEGEYPAQRLHLVIPAGGPKGDPGDPGDPGPPGADAVLPVGLLRYMGVWNATTNNPNLADGNAANAGRVYRVSTGGTINLGGGAITHMVDDYIMCNTVGTWQRLVPAPRVTTVAGKSGAVVLTKADVGLDQVANTAPADMPVSFPQAFADLRAAGSTWDHTKVYKLNEVVSYAGGLYRALEDIAAGQVPVLYNSKWQPILVPDPERWYIPDPNFDGDDWTRGHHIFWKSGSAVGSLTSVAGEFETGRQALKLVLGANSSCRLMQHGENIGRGGEAIRSIARVKLLAAAAGASIHGVLEASDVGIPEPFAGGYAGVGPTEAAVAATNAWATYTFNYVTPNARNPGWSLQ